jgi:hypothetical protein
MSSFEILEYEDAYIELIELIEYNDKSELTAREGHYIRTMDCVNIRIEGRTKKEKDKDYRENNKETLIIKAKQYRIDNIEELTKKITCECGSICSKRVIPKHKRTKKHQEFIQIVSHTHL